MTYELKTHPDITVRRRGHDPHVHSVRGKPLGEAQARLLDAICSHGRPVTERELLAVARLLAAAHAAAVRAP